jgi:4-amino-4-deoxy-L-arabinose transferase-like glycosyltransferase
MRLARFPPGTPPPRWRGESTGTTRAGAGAWAGVAAATVLAIVLRGAFVGDQSLGYEEVFTASVTGHPTLSGLWHALRATESTPPLYYLLTWISVTVTGDHSAVALRMVSLLAGCATVPVSFFAMRRFVGPRLAVVVAWLSAISPFLFEYSLYARSYAVLVLLVMLSLWALGALLEQPSWGRWILWGWAAAACLWTHYFAVFMVIAEGAVLLAKLPGQRTRLVLCSLAVAASFAPLWSLFRAQRGTSAQFFFITAKPLASRLEDVVRQFTMGTNVPSAWLEGAGILLAGAAILLAVLRTPRGESTPVFAALALIAAGLPVLGALTGVGDYLLPRNIIGAWICLAPLAAYGLTRWRGLPLVAYTGVCLAAILAGQTNWRYHRSTDWAGASARVTESAAGVPIAVLPAMELAVAGLYLHRRPLPAPIDTADLWVMVEPVRAAHQRALGPVVDPPLDRLWGPALQPVGEVDYRGFRLIHLRAPAPTPVAPAPSPYNGPATAPLAAVLAP